MRAYDPFAHAEALGLRIVYRPIAGASGLWIPEHRTVVLQPGLHRAHERSTLAHEIVHAEFQDRGRIPAQERRADRIAAERLLAGFDLRRAAALSDDPGVWALEAGVTDHLMEVHLRARASA